MVSRRLFKQIIVTQCLTHSMKEHASSLGDHFSSSNSNQTFCRLLAFEIGFDGNKSGKQMPAKNMFIIFLYVLIKVPNPDRDASK